MERSHIAKPVRNQKRYRNSVDVFAVFNGLIDPLAIVFPALAESENTNGEASAGFILSFINDAAACFLKLDSREVTGKNLSELFSEKENSKLFKAMGEVLEKRAAKKLTSVPYKVKQGRKSLRGRFDINISPFDEGLALNWKESSPKAGNDKELLKKFELERAWFNSVMAQMPSGVSIAEAPSGKLLYHNEQASRLLGHPLIQVDDLSGYSKYSAMHDFETPYAPEEYPTARAVKGEVVLGEEMLYRRGDGTFTYLSVNSAPVKNSKGEIIAAVSTFYDISEKKQTEAQIEESKRILDTLMEFVPEGITIADAKDINIRMVSRYGEEKLGGAHGGLTADAVAEKWKVYYPDGMTEMDAGDLPLVRAIEKGEKVTNAEVVQVNSKGEALHLSCNAAPIKSPKGEITGGIVAWRDITEHKKAEESLRIALQHLKFHVENSPLAVVEFNDEYQIKSWSGKAEEIFGWKAEEVLGKKISDFRWVYEEDAQRVARLSAEMFASNKTSNIHINRNYRKDGSVIKCEWYNSALVDSNGNLISVLSLVLDVTQKENTMQRLEETLKNLERSNQELEQFAYVASHDLQEPLRMVSNSAQMISRRFKNQLDQKAEELIGFIIEGSQRMQSLIQDLLSFSRITTKDDDFALTDLNTVMQNVMADLKVTIEENNAKIKCGKLPAVNADITQIRQVFQNLVSNAIKFRRPEDPEITISAERKAKSWLFSVKDNGIGIAPDFFNKIFVIFQRLHNREAYPGTGIGLAICKRIVERHKGKIWLESEEGKGSTFYFTIPA